MKYYTAAISSYIALFFLFLPWIFNTDTILSMLYSLAFFWFLFAWLILLVHIISVVVLIIRRNSNWIHHFIASVLIIISYIGLLWGTSNGYIMTA